MRPKEEQIARLNQYYFQDFVPQLPLSLRVLATNPLVLYHREVEGAFDEVIRYVMDDYWLLPWLLSDIFPLDDETVFSLSKAYLLLFLGYLVQDHLTDEQVPDLPLIPLFARHLHTCAMEQFHPHLAGKTAFWEVYYASIKAHATALSLEQECLVAQSSPLTSEPMRTIAAGKAMPFHIAAAAMASLSGQETLIPIMHNVFDLYFVADQMYDDVEDIEEDWQERRATLVFAQLAAKSERSLKSIFDDELNAIKQAILTHKIREALMRQSSETFQQALAALPVDFQESRLANLLRKRLSWNQQRLNSYHTLSFFSRLKSALE